MARARVWCALWASCPALERLLAVESPHGLVGIGHTRWATHGRPSEENAHPHKAGAVSVVHNGIVENHALLRERLTAAGRHFSSQTDTEVLAHLIDQALIDGASVAARGGPPGTSPGGRVLRHRGAVGSPRKRNGGSQEGVALVVGVGQGEMFVASDAPAILDQTREVIFLEDGDVSTHRPRPGEHHQAGRTGGRTSVADRDLDPGTGGEGGLSALHAQGDS